MTDSKHDQSVVSDDSGRVRVWDLPVRVFHWLLAISFSVAYLLGDSERWRQVHVTLGYTVLGLIAFRVIWGLVGTRYARFTSFLHGPRAALRYIRSLFSASPERHLGHNPAGSWAVYAILALGVATGITGYLTLNEIGGDAFEELHELMANAWLIVVIVHVAGVLASSFAHRENLVKAMVTGYKNERTATASVSKDSPRRPLVGVLVATAVIAFWVGSWLTGGPLFSDVSAQTTMAHEAEDDDD